MRGEKTGLRAGGANSFARRSLVYASGVTYSDWRFAGGTRMRDVQVTFDIDVPKWMISGERMWVIKEMEDEHGRKIVLSIAMNNRIPLSFVRWIASAAPPHFIM